MRQSEFDDLCYRHMKGNSQINIKHTKAHKDRGILIKLIEEHYENTDDCNEPVRLSLWDCFPI